MLTTHRARRRLTGEIVTELVREPDHSPPQSLLNRATCVAVVPDVLEVGLAIGQSTDVVLVFLNKNAPRLIASTSFDLGGHVSVAAGPVGRNLSAETDYKRSNVGSPSP